MKKQITLFTRVLIAPMLLVFALVSVSPAQEAEGKKTDKKNPMADMSIVEKTEPVPADLKAGFDSITAKDAGAYLEFIASDLLEGRDTASRGYDIAAEFIGTMFSLWGLKPAGDMPARSSGFRGFFSSPKKMKKPERTYLQQIPLKETLSRDSRATVEFVKSGQTKSRTFYPDIDYMLRASYTQTLSAPVVFVGYGISEKKAGYDDYKGIDVKGKIVMVLTEAPGMDDPKSPFSKKEMKGKYAARRMRRMRRGNRGVSKAKTAMEKGAVAVIMVENSPLKNPDVPKYTLNRRPINDERPIFPGDRRSISLFQSAMKMPWVTLPTIRVSRDMANVILGYADKNVDKLKKKIAAGYKPHSFALPGVYFKTESTVEEKLVRSSNVLGFIEGSDPKLKDEVVVIGAHLDHLGKRGDYIFNGADDNGSGSVAVMEIAQAFAVNKIKPKRSVLFALWTGEEKGLLGSRYYVTHPYFPLKKTVAYINLDMVSRHWELDRLKMMARRFGLGVDDKAFEKIDVKKFMAMSMSETDAIYNALKENNRYVGLHLHLRKSKDSMGGSDHAAFGYFKVPWTFFFAAMTKDYHQPSDSFAKVSTDFIALNARLAWLTAFTLANQ